MGGGLGFQVWSLRFRAWGLLRCGAEAETVMQQNRFEYVVLCDMLPWPDGGWPSNKVTGGTPTQIPFPLGFRPAPRLRV